MCLRSLRACTVSFFSLTQVIFTVLCPLVPYLSKCGLHWHVYSGLTFIPPHLSGRIPAPCVCFYYLTPSQYEQMRQQKYLESPDGPFLNCSLGMGHMEVTYSKLKPPRCWGVLIWAGILRVLWKFENYVFFKMYDQIWSDFLEERKRNFPCKSQPTYKC